MNWAQFKDLISHTCLAGTLVASWPQEVAGLNPFTLLNSVNSVKTFRNVQLLLLFGTSDDVSEGFQMLASSPACQGFPRITSGSTLPDLLVASMVAKSFLLIYL